MKLGMCVRIKRAAGYTQLLRNVTEIHYNYDSPAKEIMGVQCAFESDVHETGITVAMTEIVEFEATVEEHRADVFQEM